MFKKYFYLYSLHIFFIIFPNYYSKLFYPNTSEINSLFCPIYSLSRLEPGECYFSQSKKKNLINLCPSNQICIINSDLNEGSCKENILEYNMPAFPGGKCEKNFDCYSNKCENNICKGSKMGEKCLTSADCLFGLYCKDNYCIVPKPKNSKCEKNSECKFPFICYNNICSEFFSIENEHPILNENYEFLCKSGRSFGNKCNNLKNINLFCDEDNICLYENENGKSFSFKENCVCEFSLEKKFNNDNENKIHKKCLNGNLNNEMHQKAIEILKKTLFPNNTKFCNNDENRPGYCREILRNNFELRKENIFLQKYLILGKYDNLFPTNQNEKLIFMQTLYEYDNTPPKTKNIKCPIFSIKNEAFFNNNTCYSSQNPHNENGEDLNVYVNEKKCDLGYECKFDFNKIINNWEFNQTCEFKYPLNKKKFQLPGEKCNNNNLRCLRGKFKDVGQCINGICSGRKLNDICKTHQDCQIGLFCNSETHKCEELKKKGEKCNHINECQNNLMCMNNTCIEYYSLPEGTYLQKNNGYLFKELCKFGLFNEFTNQCLGEIKYHNSMKNIDNNGFVECNLGEDCVYNSGNKIISTKCECGFNKEGKSYCPLSHEYNKNEWEEFYELKKKYYKNECHTLKRDECIDIEVFDKIKEKVIKTENAHLFYNAEDAIINTLNIEYLKIKSLLFIFFVLII